jgi:cytolysin-activating lysine-acyltransferase
MTDKITPENLADQSPEQLAALKEKLAPGQYSINIPKTPHIAPPSGPVTGSTDAGEKTVATVLGEIVWLLTQSPAHRYLSLGDLEWMLMPPVLLGQYKIFRNEDQVVGVALWAYLNEEAEQRLKATGRLAPQDWGNGASINMQDGIVPNEGGNLWLIELLAPFNNTENNHQQQMLADLMLDNLKGKKISMFRINAKTGSREVIVLA